ncbi:MAG: hypothetical protein Q9213_006601 [Squamulea squamosa]
MIGVIEIYTKVFIAIVIAVAVLIVLKTVLFRLCIHAYVPDKAEAVRMIMATGPRNEKTLSTDITSAEGEGEKDITVNQDRSKIDLACGPGRSPDKTSMDELETTKGHDDQGLLEVTRPAADDANSGPEYDCRFLSSDDVDQFIRGLFTNIAKRKSPNEDATIIEDMLRKQMHGLNAENKRTFVEKNLQVAAHAEVLETMLEQYLSSTR